MVEQSARRTQAERRSFSEDKLLDAAAQLISERGVQGASLASIGDRAGLSRGLPTHHFGSKDALVARLAERAQRVIAQTIWGAQQRSAQQSGPLSALDEVVVTVDAYIELFEDPTPELRALLVMWGSTFPSSASVEGMEQAERWSYEGLSQLIASGQRDGSVRSDVDAVSSAIVLHGLMRGVAALLLTEAGDPDTADLRNACHHWVDSALAAPSFGGPQIAPLAPAPP